MFETVMQYIMLFTAIVVITTCFNKIFAEPKDLSHDTNVKK